MSNRCDSDFRAYWAAIASLISATVPTLRCDLKTLTAMAASFQFSPGLLKEPPCRNDICHVKTFRHQFFGGVKLAIVQLTESYRTH